MSDYISDRKYLLNKIQDRSFVQNWEEIALHIFRFQYEHNLLYQEFCNLLNSPPFKVREIDNIPFLPIEFFKRYPVKTGTWGSEIVFKSSGTTDQVRSHHHVNNLRFYLENAINGFEQFYGDSKEYAFLGLLPGYATNGESSLIQMVNALILRSKYGVSGFYLDRQDALLNTIHKLKNEQVPTILFGVSFALIDLFEYVVDFPELIVIETGGMKSSTIVMSKDEIIRNIKEQWISSSIQSEYGMTELFSQAYSNDGEWYRGMNTLKVKIGELGDPFALEKPLKTGLIKIIDFANLDTCSFIETQDLGVYKADGQFQILGRMDNAELRGCNLLLEDSQRII